MPAPVKKQAAANRRASHRTIAARPGAASDGNGGNDLKVAFNRPLVGMAAALLVLTAVHLALRLPLGITGEWLSRYHTQFAPIADVISFAGLLAGFVAAAAVLDAYRARISTTARGVFVALMVAGYGAVLLDAATTGPLGRPELAAPAFGNGAVSFFHKEAGKVTGARAYLSAFPETLRSYAADFRGSIRVNNSPPGTTMVFYAARRLAESGSPAADLAVKSVFGPDFTAPPQFASAVLGAWILLFGAALSFLPAWLVTSRLSGKGGFLPAAVGMLASSMLLFNPDNDTLQVTFFLWMLYFFVRGRAGRRWLWGALFGAVAAAAFFSPSRRLWSSRLSQSRQRSRCVTGRATSKLKPFSGARPPRGFSRALPRSTLSPATTPSRRSTHATPTISFSMPTSLARTGSGCSTTSGNS